MAKIPSRPPTPTTASLVHGEMQGLPTPLTVLVNMEADDDDDDDDNSDDEMSTNTAATKSG